jgi:hypothetical protein
MQIDGSRGYYGFWVKEKFYRLRKNPNKYIHRWKQAIKCAKNSNKQLLEKIKIIQKFGFIYEPAETKILHIKDLIKKHDEEIIYLEGLINETKIMRPLYIHADQMIHDGIMRDDFGEIEIDINTNKSL